MYKEELAQVIVALREEKSTRQRLGLETSTLTALLERAEKLDEMPEGVIAGLSQAAHAMFGSLLENVSPRRFVDMDGERMEVGVDIDENDLPY